MGLIAVELGAMDINLKEEARRLIDELPQGSTWDDLIHRICIRQAIEAGLEDSDAGRTTDVENVRARFKLPQ
jgi:predicted transcriptional regulator